MYTLRMKYGHGCLVTSLQDLGNGSKSEIQVVYLQEELDSLVAKYPGRFKVYYVLNQVCCLSHVSDLAML